MVTFSCVSGHFVFNSFHAFLLFDYLLSFQNSVFFLCSSANVKQKMDRMNSTKVGNRKAFGQNMTGQKNNGSVFGQKKKKKKSNKNR